MKKKLCMVIVTFAISAAGCGSDSHVDDGVGSAYNDSPSYGTQSYESPDIGLTDSYMEDGGIDTEKDTIIDAKEDAYSSSAPFTNKTGTSTTKCAHAGCDNYIASSGDTYYCVTHSKKCGACGCYIDEDAMFCPDCIIDAFAQ